MNIYKIKSRKNLLYVKPRLGRILECSKNESDGSFSVELYDPTDNSILCLGAGRNLADPSIVKNSIWNSEDIFYAARETRDKKAIFNIFKYNIKNAEDKLIYAYEPEDDICENNINFFVLSESFMLIQVKYILNSNNAQKDSNEDILENLQDNNEVQNIKFRQFLVNLDTKESIIVEDENIVKNGISSIIAISETQIMIKTGFHFDEMVDIAESKDTMKLVPIEAVFLNTPQKFIADLSLRKQTMDMQLIYSAYHDKYILSPKFKEDYVFFTVVSYTENSSESIFYNINTQEKLTCQNKNIDRKKPNAAYIINKSPYAKSMSGDETVFLNLLTMEFDLSCVDYEFLDVVGKLLIVKSRKNGRVLALRCPDMKTVMNEKGNYRLGCTNKNDCYLYF